MKKTTFSVQDNKKQILIKVNSVSNGLNIYRDGYDDKIITSSLITTPHLFTCVLPPGEYYIDSDGELGEIIVDNYKTIGEEFGSLEYQKENKIQLLSKQSFLQRENILPDYKIQNAALGIYSNQETQTIKATVNAFREEFYRVKGLIEKAQSLEELAEIKANFPNKMMEENHE